MKEVVSIQLSMMSLNTLIVSCYNISVFAAFWVAEQAIKIYIDEEDNRRPPPHDTAVIKKAILEHFNINDR
jgi:hypothetical protein